MLSPGSALDWKSVWYATTVFLIVASVVSEGNDLRITASEQHDSEHTIKNGQKYAEDGKTLMERTFMYLEEKFVQTETCEISSQLKEDLKKAQTQDKVDWSDEFILTENKYLGNLGNHARNFENENFEDWHLVEGTKYSLLKSVVKVFEGKLYFNSKKRQLVLVCIDPLEGFSKLLLSYSSQSAAVKFGEKVRLLVDEFKVRPLVLATGEGGGGHLAQLVTYSMKNLRVEEGKVKILKRKEKGVHMHTVVFESPPAFRAIEKMAKEPLDQNSLRLAITNYISDKKLIDCCATQGPHVGKVVFVKNKEAKHENQEQVELLSVIEQVLCNVGSLNLTYNKFSVEDLKEVESFERVIKEDANNSIPWFFFDKNESELFEAKKSEDNLKRLQEIPSFRFSDNLKCIMLNAVDSSQEFVAKVRFTFNQISSRVMESYTTDFIKYDFKLNSTLVADFQSWESSTVLTGFSSEQEIEFVAQLYKNSITEVRVMRQSKLLLLSSEKRTRWFIKNKNDVILILLVSKGEKIEKIHSKEQKMIYFVSTDGLGTKKHEPVRLKSLDCESATKFKAETLQFFDKKVSVSDIFTQEMLDDLTLMEILNFRCEADTEPTLPHVPQMISSDSTKFENANSFAEHLVSLEGQSLTVIFSGAGMGKTRYLEELCNILRIKNPTHWVCKMNLSHFCDKLVVFKSINYSQQDGMHALELVCKALTSLDASNGRQSDATLLEQDIHIKCKVLFEKIKCGNAWIFLDSFDEVCPLYKQEAKHLLGLLRGMGAHLVVATRPSEKRTVMDALKTNEQDVFKFKLESLQEFQIREFVSRSSKNFNSEAIRRILDSDNFIHIRKILENPGFLHLAAKLCSDEKLQSSERLNEAELFSTVVEKSLEFTLSDKIELRASSAAMLQVRNAKKRGIRDLQCKLALDAVFNQGNCDWISQEEADEVNVYDLANVSEGKVFFQHIHLALFLCAENLLKALISPGKEISLLTKTQLNEILIKEEHKNLRKMMDLCSNLEFARGKRADKKVGKELKDKNEKVVRNILLENLLSLFKFTIHWYDPKKKIKIQGQSELPLYWAFKFCSNEFIAYLIDEGARSNSPWFRRDKTILHWAVEKDFNEFVTNHFEKLKRSLDKEDEESRTPLHCAAQVKNEEMVRFLLDKGAKFKEFDKEGKTAQHYAVESGHLGNTEMLLEKGKMLTKSGESCLHLAAKSGHLPLVQLFVKTEYVNGESKDGSTPLSLAMANNHMEVEKFLRANGATDKNDNGDTQLHESVAAGDLKKVKLSLRDFPVDSKNTQGITPLQKATFHGHKEIVEFLLKHGADCKIKDNFGRSCLHYAAEIGHLKLVQIFEQKIEVNSRDNSGYSPLDLAAAKSHTKVVNHLLQIGADSHAEDNQGDNCPHYSSTSGKVKVEKMFKRRKLPYEKSNTGQTPLELVDAGKHKDLQK